MKKYILDLVLRLEDLLAGMHTHAAIWASAPVTETQVETITQGLLAKNKAIDDAQSALSQAQKAARKEVTDQTVIAEQVESLARGFHAAETAKLADYKIKERKPGEKKPAPEKGMIATMKDDVDGEGFILEGKAIAHADKYEWQKAAAANVNDTSVPPASYVTFKINGKIKFVDDDVQRGVRYFYRYRGLNATANGEWSEGVSSVQ